MKRRGFLKSLALLPLVRRLPAEPEWTLTVLKPEKTIQLTVDDSACSRGTAIYFTDNDWDCLQPDIRSQIDAIIDSMRKAGPA